MKVPRPGSRGGYSLIEALVALLLLTLLLSLIAHTAGAARRALEAVAISAERVDAARTARRLFTQLQPFSRSAFNGPGPGEVTVRMPIGWATNCQRDPDSGAVWEWEGLRLPVPTRDSALVIDATGAMHLTGVSAVGHGAECGGGEGGGALTISFDPDVPHAVILHLWEPGVARIDDAVRYARSSTSRQPLTAALLDRTISGLSLSGIFIEGRVATDTLHLWRGRWRIR